MLEVQITVSLFSFLSSFKREKILRLDASSRCDVISSNINILGFQTNALARHAFCLSQAESSSGKDLDFLWIFILFNILFIFSGFFHLYCNTNSRFS